MWLDYIKATFVYLTESVSLKLILQLNLALFGIIFLLGPKNFKLLKKFSILGSLSIFLISLCLLYTFNYNNTLFQKHDILIVYNFWNSTPWNFHLGVDGISISFFILTAFLTFICTLIVADDKNIYYYLISLFFLEFFLLLLFSTLDILVFYICFETILIPMSFMIGFLGSRARKIRAAYFLFYYTLVTSLIFLLGLIYLYIDQNTTYLPYLLEANLSLDKQQILWLTFFISFAAKVPMYPVHIWLPEAHVEAPTIGSVLLAGILLKLGIYGMIRFNLCICRDISANFKDFVQPLAIFGIILSSICAIRSTDIKRVIAYSSIGHMNAVILGLFSGNLNGIIASVSQCISHAFISGAMFFLIGVIYKRTGTRDINYYSGLTISIPLFSVAFIFFTLSNIAFPGTSAFINEYILYTNIYEDNVICAYFAGLGIILTGVYSLLLANKMLFGNISTSLKNIKDINSYELLILSFLAIIVIIAGVSPKLFFNLCNSSTIFLALF